MVQFGAPAHENDAQMGRRLKIPQNRKFIENCGMNATE